MDRLASGRNSTDAGVGWPVGRSGSRACRATSGPVDSLVEWPHDGAFEVQRGEARVAGRADLDHVVVHAPVRARRRGITIEGDSVGPGLFDIGRHARISRRRQPAQTLEGLSKGVSSELQATRPLRATTTRSASGAGTFHGTGTILTLGTDTRHRVGCERKCDVWGACVLALAAIWVVAAVGIGTSSERARCQAQHPGRRSRKRAATRRSSPAPCRRPRRLVSAAQTRRRPSAPSDAAPRRSRCPPDRVSPLPDSTANSVAATTVWPIVRASTLAVSVRARASRRSSGCRTRPSVGVPRVLLVVRDVGGVAAGAASRFGRTPASAGFAGRCRRVERGLPRRDRPSRRVACRSSKGAGSCSTSRSPSASATDAHAVAVSSSSSSCCSPPNPGRRLRPVRLYPVGATPNVFQRFGSGDGAVGVHGTNEPSSIGRDASTDVSGSRNEVIRWMAGIPPARHARLYSVVARRERQPRSTVRPRRASSFVDDAREHQVLRADSIHGRLTSAVSRERSPDCTAARMPTFASVLVRRICAETRCVAVSSTRVVSAGAGSRDTSSAVGQAARWIEPSCHHDHTSSVTKAQDRGEQPQLDVERDAQRATWRCALRRRRRRPPRRRRGSSRARGSRRRTTRRRSRSPAAPWCSRSASKPFGRLGHDLGERGEQRLVDRLGDRRARRRPRRSSSAKRDALSTFIARRRPILNSFGSMVASRPGLAPAGPVTNRVGAVLADQAERAVVGVAADFDSFLRSGSVTKPEMFGFVHGSVSNCISPRTIE